MSLHEYLQHTKQRDVDEETVIASCPEHIVKSNTIHPLNATHSLRRNKILIINRRPTTAPQKCSRFFLFVYFHLWNEQRQWGIRTNFKQGQIKVQSPKLPSILSQVKVYSTLITLLFFPSLLISPIRPCFVFFRLPLLCSLLSLLQCDLLQGPQGGI